MSCDLNDVIKSVSSGPDGAAFTVELGGGGECRGGKVFKEKDAHMTAELNAERLRIPLVQQVVGSSFIQVVGVLFDVI